MDIINERFKGYKTKRLKVYTTESKIKLQELLDKGWKILDREYIKDYYSTTQIVTVYKKIKD